MYPPSLPTTGPDNQGTSSIPAQKTYQDFIDHKTVTVEQVLEKGIAFGFREAHIHYGLEKKKPDSSDDYTYCNPNPEQESDLQQFSFKTQTDKQKKITFQEIRKQYFKHFKTTTNKALHEVRVLSDMGISRIHKRALALDVFFQRTIQNWKTETESFVEFVRREDNSFHEEHMNFLQIIANTLKERPGITSNEGCYLLALWAEFSVAQAINESGITLPSGMAQTFSLKDFQNLQEAFQVDEKRHLTGCSL